eukprot:Tamp_26091.p1 GENE.Tamp_26091~~Tamp_26091.p1  ORF type:complete len:109 (+),score=3.12 Tamp_26091:298-624(+)
MSCIHISICMHRCSCVCACAFSRVYVCVLCVCVTQRYVYISLVPFVMYDGDSVQMMETHGVMFVNAKQLCFHAAARAHTHTLSLRQTLLKWFEVLNVLLNRKPGPGPD